MKDKHRLFKRTAVLVVAALMFAYAPSMAAAKPNVASTPYVHSFGGSLSSLNWSGYAVNGSAGSITAAQGSWTVPAVACASAGTTYSSFWVGIDGFQSSTVEQTGTDSDCSNGAASYYAWYEFYPNPSYKASMKVHPGDEMKATVSYSGGAFKVTLKDVTTGASFSKSAKVSGAARSSAEFIAEAPSICRLFQCHLASLSNFGTVGFGMDNTGVAMSCGLIMNGVAGSIGSFGSSVQSISMVSQTNHAVVKAVPSALSSDGTSFTIQWLSAGP
jgi:Peptidase A4 family